ncbi:MAG: hypothetical protein HYT22_02705 [Candidatus Niyogibacteria bacterium]|nr:hypothetical protein [Candidatus Niyogibacteria bacterium]
MAIRKSDIYKSILNVIGVAGILAVAAIAPNTLQILAKLPGTRRYFSSHIHSRIQRLRDSGLIEFLEINGNQVIRLTAKGKIELQRYQLLEKIKKPLRWDGSWRLIIFDIREYKRNLRHKIREELKRFGFRQLQQSVWVYPYECQDIITLLKADFHVGKEMLYITAKFIENDKWLKRDFRL